MKRRKGCALLGLLSLLVIILVYILLVTPKRFLRCLTEPIRYLSRDFGVQEARLPGEVPGNQVELLVNGDEALPALLDQIASAKKSIRWQVMLFEPDEAGQALAGALAEASRRGVQVQLSFNIDQTVNGTIADGYSRQKKARNRQQMERMLEMLAAAGVEVRQNPAGVDFDVEGLSTTAREIQAGIQASTCISANHYDHRKLFIIDDRLAFIGGMNVGNSYLYRYPMDFSADMEAEARERARNGQPEAWEKWFDTLTILRGPVVGEMIKAFNWKWEVLGGTPLPTAEIEPVPGGVPVRLMEQKPGDPEIGALFFRMVSAAQREIWVASPFVSYDPALQALEEASRRGVRVIFVYPNAHQEMPLSGRIFRESAGGLVEAGVELYFNDLRMAHTKILVVDGTQVGLGSFNLNHRSFRHDLEVAALVEDPAFAREVIEQVFQPYLSISEPVTAPPAVPWNPLNWILKPFS